MNKKTFLISSILVVSLILTGCWDRTELENRAFIMVVGIDKYDPTESETTEKNKPEQNKENTMKMTYLLPKFSAVKEGEQGADSRQLMTTVGKSSYEMTRRLTVRSDSEPFFQHMKAAVFGVDIVKDRDQFLQLLDGLERQDEISRKVHLFVADDQASEILETESLLKPLSYKLQGMSQESLGTELFIPTTLEQAISSTVTGATLIPKIAASKEEIKVAGSAVLKNDEFIGWLSEGDTKAVSGLTGKTGSDIVVVEYKGIQVPYIVNKLKAKRSARVVDGKINVDIKLILEGKVQQYKVKEQPRLTDIDILLDMEKVIDKTVTKWAYETIDVLQNELNADVLEIDKYLLGHEPDIWDQVKDDWDEVFPKVKINIETNSYIEKIGSIK